MCVYGEEKEICRKYKWNVSVLFDSISCTDDLNKPFFNWNSDNNVTLVIGIVDIDKILLRKSLRGQPW